MTITCSEPSLIIATRPLYSENRRLNYSTCAHVLTTQGTREHPGVVFTRSMYQPKQCRLYHLPRSHLIQISSQCRARVLMLLSRCHPPSLKKVHPINLSDMHPISSPVMGGAMIGLWAFKYIPTALLVSFSPNLQNLPSLFNFPAK